MIIEVGQCSPFRGPTERTYKGSCFSQRFWGHECIQLVIAICISLSSTTSAWWRGWFWNRLETFAQRQLPKLIYSSPIDHESSPSCLEDELSQSTIVFHVNLISSLGTVTNWDRFFLCWDLKPLLGLRFVQGMTLCHCEWTCHSVLVWWCDDSTIGAKGTSAYQCYGLPLVPTPFRRLPFPVFTHRHTCKWAQSLVQLYTRWVPSNSLDSNRAFNDK